MRTPPHAAIIVNTASPIKIMKLLLEQNKPIKWKALKKPIIFTWTKHTFTKTNYTHLYVTNI